MYFTIPERSTLLVFRGPRQEQQLFPPLGITADGANWSTEPPIHHSDDIYVTLLIAQVCWSFEKFQQINNSHSN